MTCENKLYQALAMHSLILTNVIWRSCFFPAESSSQAPSGGVKCRSKIGELTRRGDEWPRLGCMKQEKEGMAGRFFFFLPVNNQKADKKK